MVDHAFHPAQRVGQHEDLQRLHQAVERGPIALDLHRHHRPATAHLPFAQLMLRVALQPRVIHLLDLRVAFEEARHLQGIGALALHAHIQGLQTAQGQVAVERPLHRPYRHADTAQACQQRIVGRHHHTAGEVGVATDVLAGRVHHQVHAQGDRALVPRRAEGVVDAGEDALGLGQVAHRLDVDQVQQRVGRRLDPDQLGFRLDGRRYGRDIVEVDIGGGKARRACAVVFKNAEGAAVHAVHHHHVGILGQQLQHGGGGVHTRGAGDRANALFQGGDTGFIGMPGGVADAAVGVFRLVVQAALGERAGGDDRRENSVIGDAELLTGVNGTGGEIARLVGHGQAHWQSESRHYRTTQIF
ncbi:hypothetical protein D3C75_658090 [compost metagenome]